MAMASAAAVPTAIEKVKTNAASAAGFFKEFMLGFSLDNAVRAAVSNPLRSLASIIQTMAMDGALPRRPRISPQPECVALSRGPNNQSTGHGESPGSRE